MPEVKEERTNWRDKGLSLRHRKWGWDCPAVDLDFLLLEYDRGRAAAIVEYKNEHSQTQYASHPSYQAIIDLGNRANLPVFASRYADDYKWYRVTPLNQKAREYLPQHTEMTEGEWVKLLYAVRGYEAPTQLLDGLDIEI